MQHLYVNFGGIHRAVDYKLMCIFLQNVCHEVSPLFLLLSRLKRQLFSTKLRWPMLIYALNCVSF
jgi:hypothetical protein